MGNRKPMTHNVSFTKNTGFGVSSTWVIQVRELKSHWVDSAGQKYHKVGGSEVGERYNIGHINLKTLELIVVG